MATPGQHNHQNSAEGAWVPGTPPTFPTNVKGSHCLLAAAGWDTPVRPSPPPMAPVCLPSSRACSIAVPKVWVQHGPVTSGRLPYQLLRWAVALTRATPPTLEPAVLHQLLAGETRRLCERSLDSWPLAATLSLGPGCGPRRACVRAHLCQRPRHQSHPPGGCCSVSASADSITGTRGLRPQSS